MLSKKMFLETIHPFDIKSSYVELDSHSTENVFNSHIHNECEIYINLSGDVSFVVENNIYPITPGSIIITRPFEYHHCVYHSDKLHKHFWLLFSATGNEYLFDKFYNRKAGENNLLILGKDKTKELILICQKIINEEMSQLDKYCSFFEMIKLINNASVSNIPTTIYPDTITNALTYINNNLSNHISVEEISKKTNVSINTLERYFTKYLDISPSAYIKKKRLSNASRLLLLGYSVTDAAMNSGFSDCSAFIKIFLETYGETPYAYKKRIIDSRLD